MNTLKELSIIPIAVTLAAIWGGCWILGVETTPQWIKAGTLFSTVVVILFSWELHIREKI